MSFCQDCVLHKGGCCADMLPDQWKIILLPSEIKRITLTSGVPSAMFLDSSPLSATQLDYYTNSAATRHDPMWGRLFSSWRYPYGIKGHCPFLNTSGCSLPYPAKPFICRVHPIGFNITRGTLFRLPDKNCPITREKYTVADTVCFFHDNLASLKQALASFRKECLNLIDTLENVSIRAMTVQDKPEVMHMLGDIREFLPPEVATAEEVIDSYLRDISAGYHILLASDNDRILGYVCYGPTPLTRNTWDIYWLAVVPHLQGKGIGSILLSWAENQIRQANGRLVLIETSGKTEYFKTVRFYHGQGWQEICRVPDFYAPKDAKLVLRKIFAP